jgi:hypothetical protein
MVATELENFGYKVTVQPAGERWLAIANMDMLPTPETIAFLRGRFEALATSFDGVYNGWAAAVTK